MSKIFIILSAHTNGIQIDKFDNIADATQTAQNIGGQGIAFDFIAEESTITTVENDDGTAFALGRAGEQQDDLPEAFGLSYLPMMVHTVSAFHFGADGIIGPRQYHRAYNDYLASADIHSDHDLPSGTDLN